MGSGRNSNSFKLLWLFLLPARIMKIHSKMNALECSQYFSYYKSMGIFPDVQGQLTDPGQILPNFKPFQYFIAVLGTYKNEDNPIKNEGARVLTTLYIDFSDAQGLLTQFMLGSGRNSNSSDSNYRKDRRNTGKTKE